MHFWFLNVIVPPICYDVWRPSKWYGRCCHGTWDGIFCVSKNRLEMPEFTGNPMFFWLGFLFLASRLILKKSQTCILQHTYRLQVSVLMILVVICLTSIVSVSVDESFGQLIYGNSLLYDESIMKSLPTLGTGAEFCCEFLNYMLHFTKPFAKCWSIYGVMIIFHGQEIEPTT